MSVIHVADYATVEAALAVARDGDHVKLPSGVFQAPAGGFRITKRIELSGAGPGAAPLGLPDYTGTVLTPSGLGDHVLVIDQAGESVFANLYLHDFRIAPRRGGHTPDGQDGIHCITTETRKISNLRIERVHVSGMVGTGFSIHGTNGGEGAIVGPQLFDCVAEGCGGNGASLEHATVVNVVHCRFKGNGLAGLRAESSELAVYACAFDGNEPAGMAEGQLRFLLCTVARVDACRFSNFGGGAATACTFELCGGGTAIGGSLFDLPSPAAATGVSVLSDLALGGPAFVLPNRFKSVGTLINIGLDDVGCAILPQYDDPGGGAGGAILLPQSPNRGLFGVPNANRPGDNALAGLILPSSPTGNPDAPNPREGTLAFNRVESPPQVRARVAESWKKVRIGPWAVSDLAVPSRGRTSLVVRWTAPGGGAAMYRLKRSTSPIITDTAFEGATEVPGVPAPGPPGSDECVADSGLLQCTLYYYALKSVDALGNESAISNPASASTRCSGWIEVECF